MTGIDNQQMAFVICQNNEADSAVHDLKWIVGVVT